MKVLLYASVGSFRLSKRSLWSLTVDAESLRDGSRKSTRGPSSMAEHIYRKNIITKERKNKERKEKAGKQSYKITRHSITRKLALLIKKIQTGPLYQVYTTPKATQEITDLDLSENKPSTVSTGTNIHLGSHSEPSGRESSKLPPRKLSKPPPRSSGNLPPSNSY